MPKTPFSKFWSLAYGIPHFQNDFSRLLPVCLLLGQVMSLIGTILLIFVFIWSRPVFFHPIPTAPAHGVASSSSSLPYLFWFSATQDPRLFALPPTPTRFLRVSPSRFRRVPELSFLAEIPPRQILHFNAEGRPRLYCLPAMVPSRREFLGFFREIFVAARTIWLVGQNNIDFFLVFRGIRFPFHFCLVRPFLCCVTHCRGWGFDGCVTARSLTPHDVSRLLNFFFLFIPEIT